MAAVYAFFAVLARLLAGNDVFKGGLSLSQTLAAELAAGVFGGLLLGLSLPWLNSIVRAGLIGLAIGGVSGFAVFVADKGISGLTWAGSDILIPYAMLGLVVAVMLWRRAARTTQR